VRGVEGVVAFVDTKSVDGAAVLARVGERLPEYMVPRRLIAVAPLPLNANGKIDRRALLQLLDCGG
jgi:acyl-coenzyme A synthetase/AMP-(fatty) acid ligase